MSPLKEEKNSGNLSQKDLRGCLAIPRRAEPISIQLRARNWGTYLLGLPGNCRTSKEKPSYSKWSVLGC